MKIKPLIKHKKAAFTDLFIIMIFAFILIVVLGIIIYLGNKANTKFHEFFDDRTLGGNVNGTQLVEDTMGKVTTSYNTLYWLSFFIIGAMVLSSIMGAYLVTTHPIFFIPYVVLLIIAVIMGAVISNIYDDIAVTEELTDIYARFTMSNIFLNYLPLWITVIGIIGGIVMLTRLGSGGQNVQYYV